MIPEVGDTWHHERVGQYWVRVPDEVLDDPGYFYSRQLGSSSLGRRERTHRDSDDIIIDSPARLDVTWNERVWKK